MLAVYRAIILLVGVSCNYLVGRCIMQLSYCRRINQLSWITGHVSSCNL